MATGTIKRDGLKNLIEVGTVNLNTLTTTGWYHGESDGTVTLTGVDAFYCLVVADGSYAKQFVVGEFGYGNTLYMRYYNGSTWTTKRADFYDNSEDPIGTRVYGSNTTTSVSVANNTAVTLSTMSLSKGTWLIVGCVNWNTNNSGYRQIAFSNGESPGRALATTIGAISGKDMYQQVTHSAVVSSSETITLYARQNSGSAITAYPSLWAIKVGN